MDAYNPTVDLLLAGETRYSHWVRNHDNDRNGVFLVWRCTQTLDYTFILRLDELDEFWTASLDTINSFVFKQYRTIANLTLQTFSNYEMCTPNSGLSPGAHGHTFADLHRFQVWREYLTHLPSSNAQALFVLNKWRNQQSFDHMLLNQIDDTVELGSYLPSLTPSPLFDFYYPFFLRVFMLEWMRFRFLVIWGVESYSK